MTATQRLALQQLKESTLTLEQLKINLEEEYECDKKEERIKIHGINKSYLIKGTHNKSV